MTDDVNVNAQDPNMPAGTPPATPEAQATPESAPEAPAGQQVQA